MIINKAEFKNFRNLKDIYFEPHSRMNVIYGENGQGKTNILEGLWLFSGAKSFRGAKDKEMVNFKSDAAMLKLEFYEKGTVKDAKITIKDKRSAEIFNKKLRTPSLLAENFHAVVFSPTDLNLIDGEPKLRRRFLDLSIGQIAPSYVEYLKEYNRAITQRNVLLKKIKDGEAVSDLLQPFEKKAAALAEKIIKYRYRYVDLLKEKAPKLYFGISDEKEELEISYLCAFSRDVTANILEKAFINSRLTDIKAGTTTIGPKKDDLLILINKKEAKNFGSQGQKRSAALVLKLTVAEILKNITGEEPVAFLDDVMSELDSKRQSYILNKLLNTQVFITCCEKENFKDIEKGKVFLVKEGELCTSI